MAAPRTRILLTRAEKELIYEKSLATPGMALHRLGEWAMTELGLERPLAVSTVAAVLKLQAAQRSASGAAATESEGAGESADNEHSDSESMSDSHCASVKRRRRSELRMRMTLQEKQELFAKYQATPDMKLRELGEWAVQQFALGRPPARSTLSVIIRQLENRPASASDVPATGPGSHNPHLQRKNLFKSESMRVEKELMAWIETCRSMGVCVQWSQVRAYASCLRDRLLEHERDPHVREKLEALQFSKGWLYRFQTDYGLIEYKRPKKPTSGYAS